MRLSASLLLGVIALAAASVWAFGQFAGGPGAMTGSREPFIREPVLAAEVLPSPAAPGAPVPIPGADQPAAEDDLPDPTPAAPEVNPFSTLRNPEDVRPESLPSGSVAADPAGATPAQGSVSPHAYPGPQAQTAAAAGSLEAQFRSRRLTYNRPPETLFLDRAIDVALIIDTSRQSDAAGRLQGLPGEIVTQDVNLSDTVAAELLGAAFDIQLQTTATRQKLSSRLPNEWRWRVTPRQKGVHTLQLNVYGYAVGSLDAEPLDSFRDAITVEVEPVDELLAFARSVQPLFAVLAALAGVGSVALAFLRLRQERRQTQAPGQALRSKAGDQTDTTAG